MRKFLLKLHLYMALLSCVFVIILGLTGSIMAFEPEIDHLIHPKLFNVTPGTHPLSLVEISAAINKALPGEAITAFTLSTSADVAYQASITGRSVFVNPYTGEILGIRAIGSDFLTFVHQLHLRLAWQRPSDPGKQIMSWAGVLVLFMLISGIHLWWPLKRVTIQPGAKGWRWWFDFHNVTGIVSLAFVLMLTITGICIGFDNVIVPMFYKATGSQPSGQPKTPPPPSDAKAITPDQAMNIARETLPGATPFSINVPGAKGSYQVRSRYPEDRTPGGRSRVIIDQYTGAVLFSEGSRTAPAGTRMVIANRAIHTGDIFGLPSKTVMAIASFALVLQVISGLMIWLKRTKRSGRG